jgi:hypothetical protein
VVEPDCLSILALSDRLGLHSLDLGWSRLRPKVPSTEADEWSEGEVEMVNPVHESSVPNESEVKAEPRQNSAPQQASVPQDKVTISPQAHAQVQSQVHARQAASAGKSRDGDSK